MQITFKRLEVENFKNHRSLNIDFGNLNKITGRNGAGKSSIGDAISWLLFGTDIMGSKLDPKPVGDSKTETKVFLTISVDSEKMTLGRIQKSAASYNLNGVPEKATAFNNYVKSLFDQNLFLSLFNPTYFFTQKWQDQRMQVLQYIDEPLNTEVLAELSQVEKEYLQGALKQHSLTGLEKIHRDRYKTQDKAYERASERLLTLNEQLESSEEETGNYADLKAKLADLIKERDALDDSNVDVQNKNKQRYQLESELKSIKSLIDKQKNILDLIKKEKIDDTCNQCGQLLTDSAIQQVKDTLNNRYRDEANIGRGYVSKAKEIQKELSELPAVIEAGSGDSIQYLNDQIYAIRSKLDNFSRIEKLKEDIHLARKNAEKVLKERNESQMIVQSIKSFKTKQAELMVRKVGELFTTISVRLYEEQKNGELRDTFEIEMDGKPYSKLSTAEKIKCGLEMIEVLSQQSGVITPTFVDNSESILKYTAPVGQLITAKVKAGELKIETDMETKEVA
ncbi:DNA repair exonuclease SbcCD ATPase subunit [Cytobacillus horneckiae]|uniref:AAA family ATPase n=1 Tax=Cytobacillus horneckiae TaxID=549687 RepID=UPI0019D2541F|nr:AAA family ATPase [Cytobacillus horneckiae]MBN6889935.1 AAA family ATPase [Cytobacillus horneckiae]